jgi:hypothetical protein
MNTDIQQYISNLENKADRDICFELQDLIDTNLNFTESKIWHAHPVWFINGNPIVGFSKLKYHVRLMFWSGQSFDEEMLTYRGDKFKDASFSVEVELEDLLIPSIPCRTVSIKRAYNIKTKEETLKILIDGDENELTKDVGFEIFINDFILPREIAKFFFFDSEKIVSLAEAKSKSELRSLSKAYSEVLGIKKYEELKNNLESLLIKLRS